MRWKNQYNRCEKCLRQTDGWCTLNERKVGKEDYCQDYESELMRKKKESEGKEKKMGRPKKENGDKAEETYTVACRLSKEDKDEFTRLVKKVGIVSISTALAMMVRTCIKRKRIDAILSEEESNE